MIDTSDILEDAWEIYWIKGHDRCLHVHVFDWRGSNIYLQRSKLLQTKLILTAEMLKQYHPINLQHEILCVNSEYIDLNFI